MLLFRVPIAITMWQFCQVLRIKIIAILLTKLKVRVFIRELDSRK